MSSNRPNPIRIARMCRYRICGGAFAIGTARRADFQLVATFADLDEGLDDLIQADPHIVLLDIELAGGAFEAAETIRHHLPQTRIIFIAASVSDLCLKQGLALGVHGFVLASEPIAQLLEHVWRVAGGEASFSAEIADRLRWDPLGQVYRLANNSLVDEMTPEQLQILRHVARGDSLKMIASKMNLSRKSVDGHKYRLMRKIGVHDRVLLTRYAIREGLIEA